MNYSEFIQYKEKQKAEKIKDTAQSPILSPVQEHTAEEYEMLNEGKIADYFKILIDKFFNKPIYINDQQARAFQQMFCKAFIGNLHKMKFKGSSTLDLAVLRPKDIMTKVQADVSKVLQKDIENNSSTILINTAYAKRELLPMLEIIKRNLINLENVTAGKASYYIDLQFPLNNLSKDKEFNERNNQRLTEVFGQIFIRDKGDKSAFEILAIEILNYVKGKFGIHLSRMFVSAEKRNLQRSQAGKEDEFKSTTTGDEATVAQNDILDDKVEVAKEKIKDTKDVNLGIEAPKVKEKTPKKEEVVTETPKVAIDKEKHSDKVTNQVKTEEEIIDTAALSYVKTLGSKVTSELIAKSKELAKKAALLLKSSGKTDFSPMDLYRRMESIQN